MITGLSLHSNGVTIVADSNAVPRQTYIFNGATFLVVDNSTIAANRFESIVTTRVTNMAYLFRGVTSFNGDISHWDTSAVTDMDQMFFIANAFNQDIGNWDTSAVTNMNQMFDSASVFNQNIGSCNTAAVTNMAYMFHNATSFTGNLSGWCVQNNFNSEPVFFKDNADSTWANDASKQPDWDGASCP